MLKYKNTIYGTYYNTFLHYFYQRVILFFDYYLKQNKICLNMPGIKHK